MDVERTVAKRLMYATGIKTVLEVPRDAPDEFISVELTGGNGLGFGAQAFVAVYSWAPTRRRAAEMAGLVELAVPMYLDEENIFDAFPDGTYRLPTPATGGARIQDEREPYDFRVKGAVMAKTVATKNNADNVSSSKGVKGGYIFSARSAPSCRKTSRRRSTWHSRYSATFPRTDTRRRSTATPRTSST